LPQVPIKAMIAEDEPLAREELAYLIRQEEDVELCPSAENGQQLLQLYRRYRPDVIFLDIEMPKRSGIDAARRIREDNREADGAVPLFVFTTAYDEYAVQAFDLEAVDYLLKPFDPERLHEAMARIRKVLRRNTALSDQNRSKGSGEEKSGTLQRDPKTPLHRWPDPKKLLVEDGEKVVVLDPSTICYAVRVNRRVAIHTEKEVVYAKITLQELEELLRNYPFYRSHRSYLVNLDYIKEIVPWFNGACNLILKNKDDTKIPVSRAAVKPLFELLQQY
jgi:two-component system, LytTR family, response regulator LytT